MLQVIEKMKKAATAIKEAGTTITRCRSGTTCIGDFAVGRRGVGGIACRADIGGPLLGVSMASRLSRSGYQGAVFGSPRAGGFHLPSGGDSVGVPVAQGVAPGVGIPSQHLEFGVAGFGGSPPGCSSAFSRATPVPASMRTNWSCFSSVSRPGFLTRLECHQHELGIPAGVEHAAIILVGERILLDVRCVSAQKSPPGTDVGFDPTSSYRSVCDLLRSVALSASTARQRW